LRDTQINCVPRRDFYTKADLALLAFLVLCLCVGWMTGRDSGQTAVIYGQEGSWRFPLQGPERRIAVGGPLGNTIVSVGGGAAEVVSSPCPDKICVHGGRITKAGQLLICAPNLVTIKIMGKGNYDALTY
jgi:hypothetical protein